MKDNLKLSDEAIVQIAKYLQLAILTGTDVVDNLRLIELSVDEDGQLTPTEGCVDNFENNIEKLMEAKSENLSLEAKSKNIKFN